MGTHVEDQTAVNELGVSAITPEDKHVVDGWQAELDKDTAQLKAEHRASLPVVNLAGSVVTGHEVERTKADGEIPQLGAYDGHGRE